MRLQILLLAGVMLGALPGHAPTQQLPDSLVTTGEPRPGLLPFDGMVREILEMTGAPGAALAVARDGRLVLARGYGYADQTAREPVGPASRFRIASVSKPITAVATLKLVEEGHLSLDDRVIELLEFTAPAGAAIDARVRNITVRDLLYHAGGWDRERSGFDPPFSCRPDRHRPG